MSIRRAFVKIRRGTNYQRFLLILSIGARIKSRFYYPLIFGSFGRGTILEGPAIIAEPKYIHIGTRVAIRPGIRLEAIRTSAIRTPILTIGDDVNIEQNVHIVCHNRVHIANNVSITANCAIVDTTHPFDGIPLQEKVGSLVQDDSGFVEIGEGTFIGIGTVILPNVSIGRGCVIGANSVVSRSIPEFSVAAGAPAIVLRAIHRSS